MINVKFRPGKSIDKIFEKIMETFVRTQAYVTSRGEYRNYSYIIFNTIKYNRDIKTFF